MNRKVFLVLFLSICALTISLVAANIVTGALALPRSNMPNATYFSATLGFEPCGDPIATPGYPP